MMKRKVRVTLTIVTRTADHCSSLCPYIMFSPTWDETKKETTYRWCSLFEEPLQNKTPPQRLQACTSAERAERAPRKGKVRT